MICGHHREDQEEAHDSGLCEVRSESCADLAAALGVTSQDVSAWKMGTAEPTISRLWALTEHVGVRDDQINLRRGQGQP